MATGATYEDALRAVCRVDDDGAEGGLYVPQIIEAASELGLSLRKKRPVNLEEDAGILHVRFPDGGRHVVMLVSGGIVVDTDAVLWSAEDYLKVRRARVNAVLVEAA